MRSHEQLYTGGAVLTADTTLPEAQAVAVRGGIIAGAGTVAHCAALLGPEPERIDLKGAVLTPGFYDTHMHPVSTIFYTMNVNLLGVSTWRQLGERLNARAGRSAADAWVIGLNFDEQGLEGKRLPDRHALDGICAGRPLIIIKHDGHSVITNTRAMEICGISPETPCPPGGSMPRDEHGLPLGIFSEQAKPLILDHLPLPDMEELRRGAAQTFDAMLAHGITSAGLILEGDEYGPSGALGVFDLPLMELLRPHIKQSLNIHLIAREVATVQKALASPLNSTAARSRIAGLKIMSDGTFGSRTACMEAPYADAPKEQGFMLHEREQLFELMRQAHLAGLQLAIHAIGDKANRTVIDLYARLLREHPRQDHRHRIEHASMLDGPMLRKVKELGLVLCVQPMFIHSDMPYLEQRIGADRMQYTYPFRSILEAGIPMAGASDAPVETQDVLAAMHCAVTREGYAPGQCISPSQALALYTRHAAHACFFENESGSITPGKRADFVILEKDLFQTPPEEIRNIRVLQTIIGGEKVYER